MYQIYSTTSGKEVCLHDGIVANETVKVIEPKLTLEGGAAGSLTFKLAPNNIAYNNYTYYEEMAGEVEKLDSISATSKVVSGSIDENGDEIASSTSVRTPKFDTNKNVTSVTIAKTVIDSDSDITATFEQLTEKRLISGFVDTGEPEDESVLALLAQGKPKGNATAEADGTSDFLCITNFATTSRFIGSFTLEYSGNIPDGSQLQYKIASWGLNGTFALTEHEWVPLGTEQDISDYVIRSGSRLEMDRLVILFRIYNSTTGVQSDISVGSVTTATLNRVNINTEFSVRASVTHTPISVGTLEQGRMETPAPITYPLISSTTRICAPGIETTGHLKVRFSMNYSGTIPSGSTIQVNVLTYGGGGLAYLGESGWTELGTAVDIYTSDASMHLTMDHVRFTYRIYNSSTDTESDILAENVESATMTVTSAPKWSASAYDGDKKHLATIGTIPNGGSSTIDIPNQRYLRFILLYENGEDFPLSELNLAALSTGRPSEHRIHMYDSDGGYLGATSWTKSSASSTLANTAAFRCEIRFADSHDISAPNVRSLTLTPSVMHKTKTEHTIDLVSRMVSIISVYRMVKSGSGYTRQQIWEGRVVSESKDFYNLRTITCEGELAYLNDTCQPPVVYASISVRQYLEAMLNAHNAKVPESKRFYVGQVWVTDTGEAERSTNYQKTLEAVNSLVSSIGGALKVRHTNGKRYLDWLETKKPENATVVQTINFGENLLDFTCDWDLTKLCTVLVPTGAEVDQGDAKHAGEALVLNNGEGPTYGQLLYLTGDDTVEIEADSNLTGYKTAVAVVEPEKNYYFSGRLHGGYVAFVIKGNADGTGDYYGYQTAGSESELGFEDFVDYKITIPAGAHSVVMCSFGDDIALALKKEIEGITKYITIEECPDDGTWHKKGSMYMINQEAVDKYGWIEAQLSRTEAKTKEELYTSAKSYMEKDQFDEMTIEVSAVDMAVYSMSDVTPIDILDYVRVISTPHGLDKVFPVTKLEIPIDSPAQQKITLGSTSETSFTAATNNINDELMAKIDAVPSFSKTMASARENAAQIINEYSTKGKISYVNDPVTGQPSELVISDNEDYKKSNHAWRFNMGGLGYFEGGYDPSSGSQATVLALTADGKIVADAITTGTLRAITIMGCTIYAGGLDGVDGSIIIRPGSLNAQGIGYAARLTSGAVEFGEYSPSTNTFSAVGSISGASAYDVDGQTERGINLNSSVMALDIDELWVKSRGGDDAYSAGKTYTFGVIDNNGQELYLKFQNGLLVDYSSDYGDID